MNFYALRIPKSFLCLLSAIGIAAPQASARIWTDTKGNKMDAILVAMDEMEIVVRLKGGKNVTIPMDRLSEADQEYAKDWVPGQEDSEDEDEGDAPAGKESAEDILNFNDPWPDKVRFDGDPMINTVQEDKEKKRFIYESANFRFIVDVRLSPTVVKGFAVMFEATQLYCRALPLGISGGVRNDGKYQVLLFETKEEYVKAGGPPTSAGVFISGRNVVMVPLTSLGVRPVGSGYMLDRDKANGTLIHEITHQLTPGNYYATGSRGWFSEGIAEYLTATRYRSGSFTVRTVFDDAKDYATAYGRDDERGRALGQSIKAPALKDFMLMDYDDFTGPSANFNYGFGLMLTNYFIHLDGEGDAARLKKFLKALHDGESDQEAIDVLLDGRSYPEMEEAISKAWKRKGIEIEFSDSVARSSDE